MTQGRPLIIVLVTLIIGFGAGIVLRPVIVPVGRASSSTTTTSPAAIGKRSASPSVRFWWAYCTRVPDDRSNRTT